MSEEYFVHARPEIVRMVDVPPRRALDVGCGAGAFGRELKARFQCEVWGIEPDAQSARTAASSLDRVINARFDDARDSLGAEHFDAIFFNDVLEHMQNPEGALAQARHMLARGGRIYASIPNVLFAPHLLEVLRTKDWRYRDAGILDRTHLRFFTRKSIVRLFTDAGYQIEAVLDLNAVRSWKWRTLNVLSAGWLNDLLPMQYGVIARVDR